MCADKDSRSSLFSGAANGWKLMLPVLLGLAAVAWLFFKDASAHDFSQVWNELTFSWGSVAGIALVLLFTFGRDYGLALRFRVLTGRDLSWTGAAKVTCLCEFTSCVTPSAVGGSSMGMFFLNREGIEMGRATTLMLTTLLLDELFFVVFCPVVILLTPGSELFDSGGAAFSRGLELSFWLIYAGIAAWTALLFAGIILWPQAVGRFISWLFRLKWLRRWSRGAAKLAADMTATSASLRHRPAGFWLRSFGATSLSWISRFMVVNALFMAFVPQAWGEQWLVLARQFVVWVVLMVCPTPGGAGLSEWLFTEFYGSLVASAAAALVMAIAWRIISYYLYLIIGACIVPKWLAGFRKNS